jgi:hypothetical protein
MQTWKFLTGAAVIGLSAVGCSSKVTIPEPGQDATAPDVKINVTSAGRNAEVETGGSAQSFQILDDQTVAVIAAVKDDGGVELNRLTAVSGGRIDDGQSSASSSSEKTGDRSNARDALYTGGNLIPDAGSDSIELEAYGRDFSGNDARSPRLTVNYLTPVDANVTLSQNTITQGDLVQLSWDVDGSNATDYTLTFPDRGGQTQSYTLGASGSRSLVVDEPGSYTVSISANTHLPQNAPTSDSETLVVEPPAPKITFNSSADNVCAGEDFDLSWTITQADSAYLEPLNQSVPLDASRTESINATTTYTLTATRSMPSTSASSEKTVNVIQPPADIDVDKTATTGSGGPGPDNFREATITTQDVATECKTFTSITNVEYTGQSFVSTESVRIVFEPDNGAREESRFFHDDYDTDKFNGMDPRGTWKLIFTGSPNMTSIPFRVTVE